PAARARARIAPADARDAGRHRTAAVAPGAIPGSGAALHAMGLGIGFWTGGNRRVCTLHRLHSTLAAALGAGRIQRNELAGPADFPEPFLERMATHGHSSLDSRAGHTRRPGRDVPASAPPPRLGAGAGVRGIVHG